ncbi:MAG TPA: secretin N-terminal domain-containing protein [Gemmatimonadaceae bacterium]|jgi:general secretion pathway protein D|nr:secretin N-terminal domain-containing protein [Gemmatimonadaceae bacterium]
MAMIRHALAALAIATSLSAQRASSPVSDVGDSVTIHLVDVDLRVAVSALAPYLDRPVVFGAVPALRVTLETPHPVPRTDVVRLLTGVVESQNLELSIDSTAGLYRVRPHEAPPPAPPVTTGHGFGGKGGDAPQLYVIHLSHARAADVASTVNALYGKGSALGEPGSTAGAGTLSSQLAQNTFQPALAPSQPAAPGVGSLAGGKSAALTGETAIIPDAGTNSLLIRASPADYELIAAAVKELDVRPLQVLIEVLIIEVSKNSNFAAGLGISFPNQQAKGTSTSLGGSTPGAGLGDFAFNVMRTGSPAFTANLSAAASKGEARILSRPVVLAENNQQAEILVGSQQPFIQVQQTQVGAVAQNQVVQYQDVGTKLTVRPTISTDGYVQLQLTQEVNQATDQVQFNAPVISTRTLQTQLLVRDSQTVVLGGLSSREKDRSSQGVPVLSSIPLLGLLFGQQSRTNTGTEFFLFLTPHIVRDDIAAARVTQPIDSVMQREAPSP